MIRSLPNGQAVVSVGPLHMSISASAGKRPSPELAYKGAQKAVEVLALLVKYLPIIKQSTARIKRVSMLPPIIQSMVETTRAMDDQSLTPMACVAGVTSDAVADYLLEEGAGRIIVNNGGDIALRLESDEEVRVGVRTDLDSMAAPYVLVVKGGTGIGGIATSGFGGRSFTKGIASAAVAIASTSAMADAAATIIGNHTWVRDDAIVTEFAERIDPDTDIVGQRVVTQVGDLPKKKIVRALDRGSERASALVQQGLIVGAIVSLKGETRFTPGILKDGKNLSFLTTGSMMKVHGPRASSPL